jgi:hypothetical protein
MSAGAEVMTTARTYSGGQLVSQYQRGTGLTRRDFVEIGDQHLKNVVLSHYHAALLVDAIGQEVQISALTPFGLSRFHRVIAVRRPDGHVEKPGLFKLAFTIVFTTLAWWFLAVIVGGILLFMGTAMNLTPLVLVAAGVFLFLVVWPIISAIRLIRTWGQL